MGPSESSVSSITSLARCSLDDFVFFLLAMLFDCVLLMIGLGSSSVLRHLSRWMFRNFSVTPTLQTGQGILGYFFICSPLAARRSKIFCDFIGVFASSVT